VIKGARGTWWEQITLPRTANAESLDVWFAPGYTAPLRLRVPVVVAIHDLSFVAHPEWFGIREGARRRWLVRHTADDAAAVITISQFTRRELIERLGVAAARVHVVPPGIGSRGSGLGASHAVASATRVPANPEPRPASPCRVLYVGSIFNRRHVVDLIRAFAPIARTRVDVSLEIVGDNRSYPHQDLRAAIAGEAIGDRVRWHEYVSDEELRLLYAGARAFAFLSEYEGLGLTPLEALAAGVPPVLLDTPIARESCGAAAIYVPRDDLNAITRALESALFDERLRTTLLAAAPAELAKYSWPRAARETLAVIERAR
jgi:glycosyltransferase involved in cell wall biosynthesis